MKEFTEMGPGDIEAALVVGTVFVAGVKTLSIVVASEFFDGIVVLKRKCRESGICKEKKGE